MQVLPREAAVKDASAAGPLLSFLARQTGDPVMAREAVSRVAGSIELRSAATMAEVRKKAVHGPLAVPFARLAADGPERRIDVPPETARALSSSAAYALSAITGLMFRAGATGRVPTMHLRGRERVEAIELVGVEPSPGPIALGAGCALDEGGCLEHALFALLSPD